MTPAQIKTFFAARLQRLRRPTRRELALGIAAVPALFLLYVLVLIPFTPGISDIRKAKQDRPAQILSADGKELALFKWANREWVPLDEISPEVVKALVATEDHRFYQHHGIDWRRLASAALRTASGDRQGGSTITQQLARNLYPDEIGRAPTLTRKLKEAITALKIEALYSKNEILETYLNTVPFLYNAFGIEMAARTYFGKSADKLDVLESATLIGMLKGNSYYNPVINPERSLQRRNTVLAQMVKRGVLDPARYAQLQKRPLRIDFERQDEEPGPAPHFAQQLRKWLIGWADRNDYNIYTDGLVVRTTIDSRLQAFANQALARQTRQLQGIADAAWNGRTGWRPEQELVRAFVRETPQYRAARDAGASADDALKHLLADRAFMQDLRQQKTMIQAGFIAIDPRDGAIKAWVGSRDFALDAFDHVQQARRQPGSTFKPFVYGAAFAQGARPEDTYPDQAVSIPMPGGEVWSPSDESPPTGMPISLRDALAQSRNRITAQLMQSVGPDRVARLARAMGVRQSPLEAVPSLALGTSPVSLKEMVSAYATIADGGEYIAPMMVTRIEDAKGEVLAEFQPARAERALSFDATQTLLDVMRGVVDRGTGTAIRTRFGIRADVAGKTGTTQDNADGWFILMHPELVAGAWVGFNDSRVTLRSDYWGQGAHSALPIVGDVFQRALRTRLVDARVRFPEEQEPGLFGAWFAKLRERLRQLFAPAPAPEAAAPRAARPARSAPAETPVQAASEAASAPVAGPAPAPASDAAATDAGQPGPAAGAIAASAAAAAPPQAPPAVTTAPPPGAGATMPAPAGTPASAPASML
ncbi:penicillin-binding protein 1A [Cupriavidus malaysiensis]|uniref:Penicillin-binding protein n=1 Tax=Cupriavidus malaysiensis TaxID=367825 RepID=A0A1D9IAX0_9BURK|nr:transglycosylase domain-containing protein [Cupriavidus malaysiensis]AOZ09125.1 penicillin-binding protein [Cupriavidus malaysiensis]